MPCTLECALARVYVCPACSPDFKIVLSGGGYIFPQLFEYTTRLALNSTAPAPLLVVISSLYIFLPSHQKHQKSGRSFFFWATSYMSIPDPWLIFKKLRCYGCISSGHIIPQQIIVKAGIGPFHVRSAASLQWLCISANFTGLALSFAILKMTEESMMRSSTPVSEQCHSQLISLASLLFCAIKFFCFA